MNRTLLAKIIWAVKRKIQAAKEAGTKYDFMTLKHEVLGAYTHEIKDQREIFSSAVSQHFGSLGAKRKRELKEVRNRLILILKKTIEMKQVQEARDLLLAEAIRSGKAEFSEDGDVLRFDDDED